MQEIIRQLLTALGEDPAREGLVNTPKRIENALRFLTSGYGADVDDVVNDALFTVDYTEMVIVRDIDFYSLCEHHLLPFFGRCHVAYIPRNKVLGLSKIPRLVEIFSRRLQVQERLTNQIAETIREKIDPLGVGVVMEATHLCMSMRGVQKQNTTAVERHAGLVSRGRAHARRVPDAASQAGLISHSRHSAYEPYVPARTAEEQTRTDSIAFLGRMTGWRAPSSCGRQNYTGTAPLRAKLTGLDLLSSRPHL